MGQVSLLQCSLSFCWINYCWVGLPFTVVLLVWSAGGCNMVCELCNSPQIPEALCYCLGGCSKVRSQGQPQRSAPRAGRDSWLRTLQQAGHSGSWNLGLDWLPDALSDHCCTCHQGIIRRKKKSHYYHQEEHRSRVGCCAASPHQVGTNCVAVCLYDSHRNEASKEKYSNGTHIYD